MDTRQSNSKFIQMWTSLTVDRHQRQGLGTPAGQQFYFSKWVLLSFPDSECTSHTVDRTKSAIFNNCKRLTRIEMYFEPHKQLTQHQLGFNLFENY